MGLVYTIIMQDDFDWKYLNERHEERVTTKKRFEAEFKKLKGFIPKLLGEWDGHMVYCLDKVAPFEEEVMGLILGCCDTAIYWNDTSPYDKKKLQ